MAEKLTAQAAGYMELEGAKKDASCQIVNVSGGVSRALGCCNKFQRRNKAVQQFRCGTCEYVIGQGFGGRLAKGME